MKEKVNIFWFRRDLRLTDNVGLHYALSNNLPVVAIFIFDPNILDQLENRYDRRVDYFHQALTEMNKILIAQGSNLFTYHGSPQEIFQYLMQQYDIQQVFCNRDYEPSAISRDNQIENMLLSHSITFKSFKDQVIFEGADILKSDGTPYTVYTPYAKQWRSKLSTQDLKEYQIPLNNFFQCPAKEILTLSEIGFLKTDTQYSQPQLLHSIIDDYDRFRDFPSLQHTTTLGIALRFGTISIRHCVLFGMEYNQVWLSELIWREFFMQILFHFPHVENHSFKPQYDFIQWRNNEHEFLMWCEGKTGYPIVDAGMRQLNKTGYMHNRARMIVASFLCKHLLIDWRWGEAYFAAKLNDFDLAANNGNWQWAAGCGCDAAPYFRIFNPTIQMTKFDANLTYVRTWIPDYDYYELKPIVDHQDARERALNTYKSALQ